MERPESTMTMLAMLMWLVAWLQRHRACYMVESLWVCHDVTAL